MTSAGPRPRPRRRLRRLGHNAFELERVAALDPARHRRLTLQVVAGARGRDRLDVAVEPLVAGGGDEGGMDAFVRQVEQERLIVRLLDELHGPVVEVVGHVAVELLGIPSMLTTGSR